MNQKKNNNDYLWDGSGEPDQEIKNLENLLGQFKYQKLNIPKQSVKWPARIRFAAVAATILLTLSASLWLYLNSSSHLQNNNSDSLSPVASNKQVLEPKLKQIDTNLTINKNANDLDKIDKPVSKKDSEPVTTVKNLHNTGVLPKAKPREIIDVSDAEEQAAKQLLVALQIASTKLNHTQKLIQGNESNNTSNN